MKFKLIAAVCKNNGIGNKGLLPWNIPEDLKFFSKVTKGTGNNAVVMGRKTWNSLSKVLPVRDNLILSKSIEKNEKISDNLVKSFINIGALLIFCKQKNYDEVWIIGGSEIYKQFLDNKLLDECRITYIDNDWCCDVYLPELGDDWIKKKTTLLETKMDCKVEIVELVKSTRH